VHAGELYCGTWRNGHVYRSRDGEKWNDAGRLGNEMEVMGMAVYNGKLYAGTLPLAEVYRYDGNIKWTPTGTLDHTPDVRYRRAWSMAVYHGQLFCGVLPSGHVHALTAGAAVSDDHELQPGWKHLAAVREGDRLKLYVDGKQVAESIIANPAALDLTNDQPLRIGFGGNDYFCGSMSDLRLYGRALTPDEITKNR
jgi:concanavalin A-like lectin/glucanase superfamily protein